VRAVLDTNVLLAGVFTRGVCERVLDICWDNALTITVVSSEFIVEEFADKTESKFGVPADEAAEAVAKLRHRVEIVNPDTVTADACRDPNDVPVLGTAVAGRADYLVTGDQDLLALRMFQGVSIVSPREFYDLICQKE